MKNKVFAGILIFMLMCSINVVWGENNTNHQSIVHEQNGSVEHLYKEMRYMMYTYIIISAYGPNKKITDHAINLAMDRMEEIGNEMNPENPKSPVYKFNHYGTPITNPDILHVVKEAIKISKESGGAFDITIHPLVALWGFDTEHPHVPSEKNIRKALKYVGWWHLRIHNGALIKDKKSIEIDLGALTKGYAVGQAVKVLKANGIKSALINGGGDIYALGKDNKKMWVVGIKSPRGKGLLGYMKIEDLYVASSGDYEHYFFYNGKRYSHIFNPKTGWPAHGVIGTTAIGPGAALTDAWGTTLFVMGPQNGLKALKKEPEIQAIIITESGKLWTSPGLKKDLETRGKKSGTTN
ncbi:MAG: FAD:protein FMN transferase [Candidatus Omnitrophica bacterium]|nr:FAD:protein FMN transferase [Candidatus Omnitrophota bacterium]